MSFPDKAQGPGGRDQGLLGVQVHHSPQLLPSYRTPAHPHRLLSSSIDHNSPATAEMGHLGVSAEKCGAENLAWPQIRVQVWGRIRARSSSQAAPGPEPDRLPHKLAARLQNGAAHTYVCM